jgi:serine/threonine protein kinase
MPDSVERQLLFAVLAFQNHFIDRGALLAAFDVWSQDKGRTIAEILSSQKALSNDDLVLAEALVVRHLQAHDGDTRKSLGHLGPINPEVDDAFRTIGDPQLQASLSATIALPGRGNGEWTPSTGADRSAFDSTTGDRKPGAMRFQILRQAGRGGLGEVFVAQDDEVPREVALKQIQSRHAHDADSRARFVQEAQITGGLEHPNIVPVYSLGTYPDGRPYYAMRFIRGESFEKGIDRFHADVASLRIRDRRLRFRALLERFIDVCNAMEYAHSRGVLHRDLKPANIMLGKFGETLVVDWGLAKIVTPGSVTVTAETRNIAGMETDELPVTASSSEGAAPTQMGAAMGTPQFMSPEQAAGRVDLLGPPSDVYSLGATLYYLLTGKPPFNQSSVAAILQAVQTGDFQPPRQVNPQVGQALDAVCRRAMALSPADRYRSPRELIDDLERWMADEPVSAWKESPLAKAARWTRKNRAWSLAGIVMMVTVSLGSVTAAVMMHQSKAAEVRAAQMEASAEAIGRALQKEEAARADGMRVAARLAAQAIAADVDLRWRILESRAADPEVIRLLTAAGGKGLGTPEQQLLQAWIDKARPAEPISSSSWRLYDAGGYQLARSPANTDTLGKTARYRDYFHGQGRDLPIDTPVEAARPLREAYRSQPYVATVSRIPAVTFSAPIWKDADRSAEPIGVLAMSVDLGEYGNLLKGMNSGQAAALVDLRGDHVDAEPKNGLILFHPKLPNRVFDNGGAIRVSESDVAKFRKLQAAAARSMSTGGEVPQAALEGNFLTDYIDPVANPEHRTVRAAVEPILIPSRLEKSGNLEWVVIVQDLVESASQPGITP